MLAKHAKSLFLIERRLGRGGSDATNFKPMRKQVESWQGSEHTGGTAKVVIYEPFLLGKLEAPKHLARTVRDLDLAPK